MQFLLSLAGHAGAFDTHAEDRCKLTRRLQRYMKRGTFTIFVRGLTRGTVSISEYTLYFYTTLCSHGTSDIDTSTTLSDVIQKLRRRHLIPSHRSSFSYHFYHSTHRHALKPFDGLYDKGLRSQSTLNARFFLVGGAIPVNEEAESGGNGAYFEIMCFCEHLSCMQVCREAKLECQDVRASQTRNTTIQTMQIAAHYRGCLPPPQRKPAHPQ